MLTHGNSTILLLTRHRVLAKCMFIFGNVYMRKYILHTVLSLNLQKNARCIQDVKRECTQYFVFISMFVKRFWLRVHGLAKVYELHRHRNIHCDIEALQLKLES